MEMIGKKCILGKWKWWVRNVFQVDEIVYLNAQGKNFLIQRSSYKFRLIKGGLYWIQFKGFKC